MIVSSPWFWGVLIGLCAYPDTVLTPTVGLDPSAGAGYAIANATGLDQGTQFVWTYGPLGFLEGPSVVSGWLTPLSMVHFLALRIGLAVSLVWALRRSLPLVAAVALAYAGCAATQTEVVPLALATVWALIAVAPDPPPWSARLLTIGGGVYCAIEALVRLNVGAGALVVVAIAVVAMPGPRLRHLATLGATFLGVVAVLWFASGQGIGNIDDFLRSSAEIVSGYSQAMGIEQPPTGWDGALAAGAVLVIVAITAWTTRGLDPARRVAAVAIVLIAAFFAAKQAFVRHDGGHAGVFAGVAIAALAAIQARAIAERAIVAVGVLALALTAAPIRGLSQSDLFRPVDAMSLAVEQSYDVFVPGERGELADAGRERLRELYALDSSMLSTLRGGTVHIEPWEAGLVWAYDLDWEPLPVFQEYAAYTGELDELNADALASPDGPDLVLRKRTSPNGAIGTIDFRYGGFDAPATVRSMLCNFRAAQTDDEYQLLERTPDRCGAAREVGAVDAEFNAPIPVPRVGPDELLFARVIDDVSSRLRSFVYKDVERTITLDEIPYRFIGSNADNGILLTAPKALDFPAPFAFAPNPQTITFGKESGLGAGPQDLRVEFFAVPVAEN